MSNENLWGEDEPFIDRTIESETDINGIPVAAAPVPFQRPKSSTPPVQQPKQEIDIDETVLEELDTETEDDYSNVLDDAHLRLEQGSLYKMIMNHHLFEGVDADPIAVQNVQKEIRQFAKERMEIMLGMRKETSTVEHLEINFPFNTLEVTALKALARAATKGATDDADDYVPEVKRITEETDVSQPHKRNSINPIGGSSHQKTAPPKKATQQSRKPLHSKPNTPIKRSRQDLLIDQIAREEGIPRELLEENMAGVGGKPLNQMSEDEIRERNKLVSQRRALAKSTKALPQPTVEQMEQIYTATANQVANGKGDISLILQNLKKSSK
jgi:hypothetical protein